MEHPVPPSGPQDITLDLCFILYDLSILVLNSLSPTLYPCVSYVNIQILINSTCSPCFQFIFYDAIETIFKTQILCHYPS